MLNSCGFVAEQTSLLRHLSRHESDLYLNVHLSIRNEEIKYVIPPPVGERGIVMSVFVRKHSLSQEQDSQPSPIFVQVWPWLGPLLAAQQYVMYTSGFVVVVIFVPRGQENATQHNIYTK